MALGYHSFALSPLLLIAELGLANGIDLYAQDNRALERLARFIVTNARDTSAVAKLAGAKQKWNPAKLPWSVIGARRFSGETTRMLSTMKDATDSYMGGDQRILFGA